MNDLYEITVKGHLDSDWAEWFEGLTVTHSGQDDTVLSGRIVDQAALHGILDKVRDLNLTLVAIKRVEAEGESS
jgi:hypothetical protein